MTWDDIDITALPVFYSRKSGDWSDNDASNGSWSLFGHSGVSCNCVPDNTGSVIIGNSHTINMDGTGTTSGIEVTSGSSLIWTSGADLNITRGANVIVDNGGKIDQNGNNANIDFETSNVINTIEVNDATDGLDVVRIRLRGNGDITVNITGTGKINLSNNLLFGFSTNVNNSVINSFTGDFQVNSLRFNSANNSFTNQTGSEISANNMVIVNNENDDDNNTVTNNGVLNVSVIDLNNANGFILNNNGTINLSNRFRDVTGTESFNNRSGAVWNYSGTTNPAGLAIYCNVNGANSFVYEGSDQILISPRDNYYNLVIDGGGTKTLKSSVSVGGTLTLTSGVISSTASDLFTFLDGSGYSGGSNTSYIDGPVAKIGNNNFTFPTGNNGIWARIGINTLSGSGTFTAEYIASAYSDVTNMEASLYNVSNVEYWVLSSSGPNGYVSLYSQDIGRSGIGDITTLVVARYDTGGSQWINEGQSSTNNIDNLTSNLVTSFSPFTFGSTSANNPLPIELLSFNAILTGEVVDISWATASEINNDFFTLERSDDAINWSIIGEVMGAGNSNVRKDYEYSDHNPIPGLSYYRLKQTDFDGKFEYFTPTVILYEPDNLFKVFPNPTTDILQISTSSDLTVATILIKNLNGQTIAFRGFSSSAHQATLDISNLPAGVYLLEIVFPESVLSKRIVKK